MTAQRSGTSSPRSALAGRLAVPLLVLAAPGLILPGPWTPLALLLGALSWAARWLGGRLSGRTVFDLPVLLLLLSALIGTAISTHPSASLSKLLGLLLGVSACYALAAEASTSAARMRFAAVLAALGAAIAMVGLVGTDFTIGQVLPIPALESLNSALPRLVRNLPGSGIPRHGELINPRELGGSLTLFVPLAATLAFGAAGRWRRLAFIATTVLTGATMLLTQSPSAIAGVGLALWLLFCLADARRARFWALLGVLLTVAGVALVWWLSGARRVLEGAVRLTSTPDPGEQHAALGLAARLEFWPRALEMIRDTPYTGIGLNTFPWIMDTLYPGFVIASEAHAHNLLLATATDLGLPGLVAFTWLLVTFLVGTTGVWRSSAPRPERLAALGLALGVAAFLVFGLVDAVTLGAKPLLALWLMFGLGLALARSVGLPGQRLAQSLRLGLVATLAVTLLAPLTWDGARLNAGRVLAAQAIEPDSPAPLGAERTRQIATTLLREICQSGGCPPGSWYALGMLETRAGDQTAALVALERGAALDAPDSLSKYALSSVLLAAERPRGWPALRDVYRNWSIRFPERAEWHVLLAIAAREAGEATVETRRLLASAEAERAKPRELLEAQRARLP